MRLIIYGILLYLAYRLIKSWLLKTGASRARPSFSAEESSRGSFSSQREKDVTERSKVLDD
jgi:hypothetical protein